MVPGNPQDPGHAVQPGHPFGGFLYRLVGVDMAPDKLKQDVSHFNVYLRHNGIYNIHGNRDMVQGTQLGILLVPLPMACAVTNG